MLATVLILLATLENVGLFNRLIEERSRFAATALVYFLVASVLVAASFVRRRFQLQLVLQVFCDLIALLLLMHAAGGARSGVGVLMLAAVAGAAVLSPPRLAAFFAASATLLLLGEAVFRLLTDEPSDPGILVPSALIGAACFLTAELVNRLATRLSAQESLAAQRGLDLRRQLAVTELVMTQLPQGVVVLDEQGTVRAMNRSAQAMFGTVGPWPGLEALAARLVGARGTASAIRRDANEPELIVDALELGAGRPPRAVAADEAPGVGQGADIETGAAPVAHMVRVRMLSSKADEYADAVLVIEDQREVEDRAQQLKLASMGRLSASIAHEIRNPLAAIRYANALLSEQLSAPAMQRLSRIVEDNTVRIDRIVRDVLSVARREPPVREKIDVGRFLADLTPELVQMAGGRVDRIALGIEAREPIRFDPGQLRQVIVNLVSNALRHATQAPGAVRLEWRRGPADRLEFRVVDDGPGLAPDMIEHVFEPFFTTGTQGTGLGLYLAREICAANQAALRYEASAPGGRSKGAFVILSRESAEAAANE